MELDFVCVIYITLFSIIQYCSISGGIQILFDGEWRKVWKPYSFLKIVLPQKNDRFYCFDLSAYIYIKK